MGLCFTPKNEGPINYIRVSTSKNKNLQLEFTLHNCTPGSKYYVVVEFLNTPDYFQTETVICHGNNITFNSTYLCSYMFEKQQLMRVTVFKNDQNIGSFTPYLDLIVGSPNSTFQSKISADKPELIIISAKGIGD